MRAFSSKSPGFGPAPELTEARGAIDERVEVVRLDLEELVVEAQRVGVARRVVGFEGRDLLARCREVSADLGRRRGRRLRGRCGLSTATGEQSEGRGEDRERGAEKVMHGDVGECVGAAVARRYRIGRGQAATGA
jgi:hypothetical protein